MSNCSGPNCTHESHGHPSAEELTKSAQAHLEKFIAGVAKNQKPLTKNQMKARRRRGLPGY